VFNIANSHFCTNAFLNLLTPLTGTNKLKEPFIDLRRKVLVGSVSWMGMMGTIGMMGMVGKMMGMVGKMMGMVGKMMGMVGKMMGMMGMVGKMIGMVGMGMVGMMGMHRLCWGMKVHFYFNVPSF